ncbi:DeoR/GlpR family DNA-binding transcription regulator [Spiroplasma culicicola]|uniref:DeoR family transcriptional regulator n=1 Tax=Spiroplasma culicicola AES-1 TaxID=1276246 RepID=W6A805_9MOLU|nr:DeoR/GlpR family DNA-binding transcription regulator [Spiroplasma culicicola]AHI53020.1 DeoR family transcriptional regulator [Spiroplasma culicicola AES-1]
MEKLKKGERIKLYFSYLNNNMSISIKQFLKFAQEQAIPEITARRDIKLLENLNYITSEMGLIKLNTDKEYETTREEKFAANREEKQKIGLLANDLINSQEIFVGAGTTCEIFVKSINKPIKMLYTNGFEVARVANANPNIKRIVLIGGKLRPQSSAMCGSIANTIVESLKFSQTFITITNMDNEFNAFNNNADEAYLTNKVILNSHDIVCLMDHTKFNQKTYGNKITNAANMKTIICDKEIDDPLFKQLQKITNVKW